MVGIRKISDLERRDAMLRNWPEAHANATGIMRQLLAAVERLRQIFGPQIAAHGIQPGDFDVLATLRAAGHPFELSPTAIYRQRCMSSGGLTKIVHRLEGAGLVRRSSNPNDRRSQLIRLSARGKRVVESTMKDLAHLEGIVLAGFRHDEAKLLSGLLDKLHQSMALEAEDRG